MITTEEEYKYAQSRGYEPLIEPRLPITHWLRVSIQKSLFGKNGAEGNAKFYKWVIEHKENICEECGKPISHATAINVSHILTRGAHPAMAHDPRNVNILCVEHHAQWENGDRENMKIYAKNERMIKELKREYYE